MFGVGRIDSIVWTLVVVRALRIVLRRLAFVVEPLTYTTKKVSPE